MEIKIDYYIHDKITGKTVDIKHGILTSEDIELLAKQRYEDAWSFFNIYYVETKIDKVII